MSLSIDTSLTSGVSGFKGFSEVFEKKAEAQEKSHSKKKSFSFDPNHFDEDRRAAPAEARILSEEKPKLPFPTLASTGTAVAKKELLRAMLQNNESQKEAHVARTRERQMVIDSIHDQVKALRDANLAELIGNCLGGVLSGLGGVTRLGYIRARLKNVASGETNTIQKILAEAEAVGSVMTGASQLAQAGGNFGGKQFQADGKFFESFERSANFTQGDEDEHVRSSKEIFQSASRVLGEIAQLEYNTLREMHSKI